MILKLQPCDVRSKKGNRRQQTLFILGSSSPRRIEMLKTIGLKFDVIKPDIKEKKKQHESPKSYVKRNSLLKARWVAEKFLTTKTSHNYKKCFILSADTIVVLNNKILEKPRDRKHAAQMLKMLSGKTHKVITAFTVMFLVKSTKKIDLIYKRSQWKLAKEMTKMVFSDVTFKKLSTEEITFYVATGEPDDKAGAYAVQGVGSYIVKSIKGSYTNVVGLPLTEMVECINSVSCQQ